MAHYEYSKTWDFTAAAEIPYRYTCCKCGRAVRGSVTVKEVIHAKDTARDPSQLGITSAFSQKTQQEVVDNLRKRLEAEKREIGFGDFKLLEPCKKCPHCGATQRWATHPGTAVAFTVLTLGALALIGLCVRLYLKDRDRAWLACTVVPLFMAVLFGLRAAMDWKDILSSGSRSKQKPEVLFDEMTSPWLDQLNNGSR